MKFAYSFQKVLDVKTNEKKQAESELAQALAAMSEAEHELSEFMLAKYRVQQRLADDASQKRPIADMMSEQRYVDHLAGCIASAKRKLEEAERTVNALQDTLTTRSVDEKVWQNAKEKAYAAFRADTDRRAQFELDEMATNRSRRLAHG